MKVLESFLISLGLKVDDKGFKEGQKAFDNLASSATQLGATFAAKLGIQKVIGDFVEAGVKLDNFNKLTGIGVDKVQQLGYALEKQGGHADDAYTMLSKIQALIASPATGQTGWMGEASKFMFNPDTIIKADDVTDAILRTADAFQGMNKLQQLNAGRALGFDDSQIRFLQQGREAIEKQFADSRRFNQLTKQNTEDANKYKQAMQDVNKVFDSMGNVIGGELTPAMDRLAHEFLDFYLTNKKLIDSGLQTFFKEVADHIELVAAAMALLAGSSALKGLAALSSLLGLMGGGKAGAGAGGALGMGKLKGALFLGTGAAIVGGIAGAVHIGDAGDENESDELANNVAARKAQMGMSTDNDDPSGTHQALMKFFMSKGWSKEQAAGIAANLSAESSFDPKAVGDGGQAYGIAQWHPDRQAEFRKFAGKDIRGSSIADQANFVNYELRNGKYKNVGDMLGQQNDAYKAGDLLSKRYESPKDDDGNVAASRGKLAKQYAGATINDNRSFVFNNSDEATVKKVIGETFGDMADKSIKDMRSPEK